MNLINDFEIRHNQLQFNDELRLSFHRTLRIPDDGTGYPLPPGLGCFPLRRVDDYQQRVPASWRQQGGVFLPMFQREAMWICFHGQSHRPHAIKVGIGKVCAITGKRWSERLRTPQDYVVTPPQPWLDGIAVSRGTIRQFVAMPLGMGYTVEGQRTGEEIYGGVQVKVFPPKPGRFPTPQPPNGFLDFLGGTPPAAACAPAAAPAPKMCRQRAGSMGLGAGGRMKQKIYPDHYGLDTWNRKRAARVFVHIVNSELWREITGEAPPPSPVTARQYAEAGLPWYSLYDEGADSLAATKKLSKIQSLKQVDEKKSPQPLQDDDPIQAHPVKKVLLKMASALPTRQGRVRDGDW